MTCYHRISRSFIAKSISYISSIYVSYCLLQSINCSILRTPANFSNQRNSFRLDIDAIKLKRDHLVESAMLYQRDALRLTFNRYFTRRSKLRVNTQSHRRAIKLFYATTYHDFVYIFVKYRYKIPNTKLYDTYDFDENTHIPRVTFTSKLLIEMRKYVY